MVLKGVQKRPELGVENGALKALKGTPNGVSSQAREKKWRVEPIPVADGDAWFRLRALAKEQPRSEVVEEREDYLWLELASRVFGFIDDLELYWNREAKRVEVRSEARLGYSDLGVNRKRVEDLRAAWMRQRGSDARG